MPAGTMLRLLRLCQPQLLRPGCLRHGAVTVPAAVLALAACATCATEPAATPGPPPEPVTAAGYCEATVEMFCDFYLRCGRMAVSSLEECHTTFLEVCNGRYEPHYVALEARGELVLSPEGLAACRAHLATVECSQQVFDLDGGCQAMWQGQVPAGGSCGPGIESFVCDRASTCVIGLDLCGTCQPTVAEGESCGETAHCTTAAECLSGLCVRRALPGEPCGAAQPCVLGTGCVEGVCQAAPIVGLFEACDAQHRCPYRAACIAGQCVQTGLAGDPCEVTLPCASGFCDGANGCVPLLAGGEACEGPGQCVSSVCDGGSCVALPGPCFE